MCCVLVHDVDEYIYEYNIQHTINKLVFKIDLLLGVYK